MRNIGYTTTIYLERTGTAAVVVELDQFGPLYRVRMHKDRLPVWYQPEPTLWFFSERKATAEFDRRAFVAEENMLYD